MTIRQAIESINATFVAAINRGDAAKIAMLYTEDCSVLVPNHATLRGRDEGEAFFKDMIDSVGGTTTLDLVEVADEGDWAYQWADYTLEADAVSDAGRVVEVFRRQSGGSWKIHLSIFNSASPAP